MQELLTSTHSDLAWTVLAALALAIVLLRFRPAAERSIYLNTLFLFFAGLAGQIAGLVLDALALTAAAG
jgi:hypothetical protein